jgi:hypothetical protein
MMTMMMIPSPSNSMAGHAAYHMAVITCTNYSLTDVLKKCVLDLRLYYAMEKQDSNKHFSLSGTPFSRASGLVTFDVLPGISSFVERSALCKIMH